MIQTGLGQSEHTETRTAVRAAIQQCRQQLKGNEPQAGIVITSGNFDFELMLSEINSSFQGIDLIGCTTAGDFSSRFGFSDDSISLLAFYSENIQMG